MEDIHIGKMIRSELDVQGRRISWLAAAIHSDVSNVYKMLKRPSIDIRLLMQISELLQHDFLKECSDALELHRQDGVE